MYVLANVLNNKHAYPTCCVIDYLHTSVIAKWHVCALFLLWVIRREARIDQTVCLFHEVFHSYLEHVCNQWCTLCCCLHQKDYVTIHKCMFEVPVDKQESTIKTVAWWVNYKELLHPSWQHNPGTPCSLFTLKGIKEEHLNFLSCFVFFLISIGWCHLKHLTIAQACN